MVLSSSSFSWLSKRPLKGLTGTHSRQETVNILDTLVDKKVDNTAPESPMANTMDDTSVDQQWHSLDWTAPKTPF